MPRATCLTPNAFELARLSGTESRTTQAPSPPPARLGPEVLATSIPAEGGRLSTLLITQDDVHTVTTPRQDDVPHGTGDFLSGLYLAARLVMPPGQAFADAMKTLARAIALSAGTPVLDVAGALARRMSSRHRRRWLPRRLDRRALGGNSSRIISAAASRSAGDGCCRLRHRHADWLSASDRAGGGAEMRARLGERQSSVFSSPRAPP